MVGTDVYVESATPPSIFIAVGSRKDNTPDPLVPSTWLLDPSAFGKV